MRLHSTRTADLLRCPPCSVNPQKTVSPPSPGHNRRLVPYRPPFPIQHLQPARQCGLPNRAHLRGQVDFASTGHVHGDRSFHVHGDRSFHVSMGTGRSILCCVHGDRSICGLATDLHVYGDGSILFHPWGQVDFVERPMGTGRFFHLRGQVGWSLQKAHSATNGRFTSTGPMTRRFVDWSILSTCLQGRVNFVFHPWGTGHFVGCGDGCGWHESTNPGFIW